MTKILKIIMLLGLLLYTLFVTTSTSLQVGGICLGMLALIPLLFFEHKRLKEAPFNLPILCFIITFILSSLFSHSIIASLDKTRSIVMKILVYYLVIMAISDIKWGRRLIYILLIVGGIGIIIKWQLGLYEYFERNRSLGQVLGMMLPLSICIFWFSPSIYQRIGFVVISFLLLTLLLLTLTRGAWIGALIAIAFMGTKHKRIWLLIPIFLYYGSIFPHAQKRTILTFKPHYSSNLCRIYIWKEALETIKENPILGIGASFKTSCMGSIHTHCHNNLINVAVSCGLLGLFAFIWLMIEIFKYSIKAIQDKNNPYFFLKLGIFSSLIDWFIHGLVDTTYLGKPGYLFWFLLGIMVVLERNVQNKDISNNHYL